MAWQCPTCGNDATKFGCGSGECYELRFPTETVKPPVDTPDITKELLGLFDKCLNSPGFVLMLGVLGKEDEKGNRVIDFYYQRQRFSLDDTKETIKAFKEHLAKDAVNTE